MAGGTPPQWLVAAPVALVGLTFLVWLRMYQLRFAEMRRSRIAPQAVALSGPKHGLLRDTRASDNLANLFELPVLFYAGVLLALQQSEVAPALVILAWLFVALRVVHSVIHCSYNRVTHRFVAYVLGAFSLFGFWSLLAWELLA